MGSTKSIGVVVGGLILVLSSTLLSGAVPAPRSASPAMRMPRWAQPVANVDAALVRGDVVAARLAWDEAYSAVLPARDWEGFAEAGDAYLRLARATGVPDGGAPRARDLYLTALFRARDAGSVPGVLRIADSFTALGDQEVAAQAQRMAARMRARDLHAGVPTDEIPIGGPSVRDLHAGVPIDTIPSGPPSA